MTVLGTELRRLETVEPLSITGSIAAVRGLTLLAEDLPVPVGSLVRIGRAEPPAYGEVVGFDGRRAIVMLLGASGGVRPGDRVVGEHCASTVVVGQDLLGRVIDALGRPIDGGGPVLTGVAMPLDPAPTNALARQRISTPIATGVRVIDSLVTVGRGQRLGIFAGPGLGKSTLLGSIARNTEADVNVIALIGERGREVRDFIEASLGDEGLSRSIVVVATSDESPLMRIRAMSVACAAAEYFRDQGADVMLMMDSITRYAQAQRQVGLAVGEPPATKGYTPSVFAMLPRVLERAGAVENTGAITGFYAVLVEGDEATDPIADAVRGVLDGHLALSSELAQKGHYPAIDVLRSISRVADDVCDAQHVMARRRLLRLCAAYEEVSDLVQIGAYAKGSNPESDLAIVMKDRIDGFLQQTPREAATFEDAKRELFTLVEEIGAREHALTQNVRTGSAAR